MELTKVGISEKYAKKGTHCMLNTLSFKQMNTSGHIHYVEILL